MFELGLGVRLGGAVDEIFTIGVMIPPAPVPDDT